MKEGIGIVRLLIGIGMAGFGLLGICNGVRDLMVIWCTNNTEKGDTRSLAKEETVTQVKFWLVGYLIPVFLKK